MTLSPNPRRMPPMMHYILTGLALLQASAVAAQEVWETIPDVPPMPTAQEAGTAEVNGIQMYYALHGAADATPILLIHGGLAHGDIWSAQVSDLMQDHRVIVADTRGHGRSTNDGSAYSVDLLASDYAALLEHLELGPVHLVGWSDGANIGYSLSLTRPDLLSSHFAHAGNVTLAGIDPSVETNPVFGAYVGKMAGDYAQMSPTPDGFDAFLSGVAAMWGTEKENGLEALAQITVPTRVVQSAHDEAILLAHSEEMAATLPGATLLVLDDVSHFAMFQQPDSYTQAIRDFIE